MSIFSRVRDFFRDIVGGGSDVDPDELARDEAHTVVAETFGEEDQLVEIWNVAVEDNIDTGEHLREFTLDAHGAELFRIGWADDGEDTEDRVNARNEFFELMEAFDISRDEFDWDAWRDWYEDA